jgi:hypothetical protein
MSPDGATVVGNCPGGGYAWSWTQAGGLVVLGPGNAYGVAGNTIVGSSGDLAGVWLNGVFTPLPAAVNPSAAFAVSDDGEWIGGFNQSLAARWRVSEDGLRYEYVPGDATPGVSRAWFDVNSLGDAVGTEARSQSTSAPFLLVNGVPFPVFVPPEKQQGEANAVNTWGLAGGRFADVLPLDLGEQAFIAPSAAFLPPGRDRNEVETLDFLIRQGIWPAEFDTAVMRRLSDLNDLGGLAGEATVDGAQVGFVATPSLGLALSAFTRLTEALVEREDLGTTYYLALALDAEVQWSDGSKATARLDLEEYRRLVENDAALSAAEQDELLISIDDVLEYRR